MRILMIQPIYDSQFTMKGLVAKAQKIVAQQMVDLVVFPESFGHAKNYEAAMRLMHKMAVRLNVAVLSGMALEDGSEWGLYVNPAPAEGETAEKAYVKHSTAEKVAFDFDVAFLQKAKIFEPIILSGQKIQAIISHDLFFPLITEKLEKNGMDILIHLSEGNVNMSKWHNILRGRSYETDALLLCTMGHDPLHRQPSDIIAYKRGVPLIPEYMEGDTFEQDDIYHLFDLDCLEFAPQKPKKYYSSKKYDAFTVGLDDTADVWFDTRRKKLKTHLPIQDKQKHSFRVEKDGQIVHIHKGTYEDLKNRLFVYEEPSKEGENHIFIYHINDHIKKAEAIALLKLRAIESRIAVVIIAKNAFFGAKTTRYKDIQLFKPSDNKIGFDLAFMKGVASVFQKSNTRLGIPKKYQQRYLALYK